MVAVVRYYVLVMTKEQQRTLIERTISSGFVILAFALFKPFGMGQLGGAIYLHLAILWVAGIGVCYLTEAVLSHLRLGFPSQDVHHLGRFVRDNYPGFPFTCDDYDDLLALMRRDKKSRNGELTCTLLTAVGDYRIEQAVTPGDMTAALDILRDLLGL